MPAPVVISCFVKMAQISDSNPDCDLTAVDSDSTDTGLVKSLSFVYI